MNSSDMHDVDVLEVLNSQSCGRQITDGKSTEFLPIGSRCKTSSVITREDNGYKVGETGFYNGIINFVKDAEGYDDAFHDMNIYTREGTDSILVNFQLNDQMYNAFIDKDAEPPRVKFDGVVPDDYLLVPVVAEVMQNNEEFRDAFNKMCDESLSVKERMDAAGIACDAFEITVKEYADDYGKFKYTTDELTPEMIERFTHQMTALGDDKSEPENDALEYDFKTEGFIKSKALFGAYLGQYRMPENITEEEKDMIMQKIPDLSEIEKYVPVDDFDEMFGDILHQLKSANEVFDAIDEGKISEKVGRIKMHNEMCSSLLSGPPSTGKSTTPKVLAAALGLPLWQMSLNHDSEADTMEGKTRVKNGQIDYEPSVLINGFKYGGIVLIDEINLANQGMVEGILNPALDSNAYVNEQGGSKPVYRRPNTIIFATRNRNLEGTRDMNDALESRFNAQYDIDPLTREQMIDAIQKQSGCDEELAAYIYSAYDKSRTYIEKEYGLDSTTKITMRGCVAAAKKMSSEFYNPKRIPRIKVLQHTVLGAVNDIEEGLNGRMADMLQQDLG